MAGLALAGLIGAMGMASASASTPWTPVLVEAPLLGASAKHVVPNSYIVVLKDQAGLHAAGLSHASSSTASLSDAVARGRKSGAVVKHQYHHALNGYAATLDASALTKVRADPAVAYVEANQIYRATGTTQKSPTWGLDRVDQRKLPLSKSYYYSNTGAGVTAYVLDTGIRSTHLDFRTDVNGNDVPTRVSGGTCDLPLAGGTVGCDSNGTADCDGHGTHVAGTIGGVLFGVAKGVNLVPVRVLGCDGASSSDAVAAGLDWIVADHGTGPAVANMSLTNEDGVTDTTVDNAVRRVIADGVTVVVAAGNGHPEGTGFNFCTSTWRVSPSDVAEAITVGATSKTDKRSAFSNYGSCVDLYAPGEKVASDWIPPAGDNDDDYYAIASGTSMAAPHVTGAVALYLQNHPTATPATVQAAIVGTATQNQVTNISTKYPRRLLFALQPVAAPQATNTAGKITSGTALIGGQRICSPNTLYCFYQRPTDGRLVLQKPGSRTIWQAPVAGTAWTRLTPVGALTSYDKYGRPLWSSKTTSGASTLFVRSSGNVELINNTSGKLVWSTKTTQKKKAPVQSADSLSTLLGGGTLYRTGHKLVSPNGIFTLALRGTGDLVLSKKDKGTIWHSGVKDDDWLTVRTNGDLELVRSDGKVVWKTATTGKGAVKLILKNTGNLALTRISDNKILWSTKTSGA